MITYDKRPFGLNLLFRANGSAIYRASIPGLLSALCFVWMSGTRSGRNSSSAAAEVIQHPYAVGVLVGSISLLLVFRVQIAYARYWEAVSAVYQMMSKWMDATIHTVTFHLQCSHYDHIKPPSYMDYHYLNRLGFTRDRERLVEDTVDLDRLFHRSVVKSIESVREDRKVKLTKTGRTKKCQSTQQQYANQSERPHPVPLEGTPVWDGNWSNLFADGKSTFVKPHNPEMSDSQGFASFQGGRTPPLFLQELAHLSSLLSAVALSTLRNDVEGAQSPLDVYQPGAPWPKVNAASAGEHTSSYHSFAIMNLLYFFGMGRSPVERTKHNAARPLSVLGGASDAEIRFLQMARGPYAKTQLCWTWLSELIMREHLAGTLGAIGPPIVSRVNQFLSDGMTFYNHARKIMATPFPFPHAQLSAYYVVVAIPSVALLMDQYTDDRWLGGILTFLSVTCLAGIQEVARELENPFRNVPNELPLLNLQAQYNEALITMYSGYHPDFFWAQEAEIYRPTTHTNLHSGMSTPHKTPLPPSCPRSSAEKPSNIEATLQMLIAKIDEQQRDIDRLVTAMEKQAINGNDN